MPCQWVAVWPSILAASLPPTAERLSGSQGNPQASSISISRAFFKTVPALCYNSLDDEGNNFIIYLPSAVINSKKDLKRESFNSNQSNLLFCFMWTKWLVDWVFLKTFWAILWCVAELPGIRAQLGKTDVVRSIGRSINALKRDLFTCPLLILLLFASSKLGLHGSRQQRMYLG